MKLSGRITALLLLTTGFGLIITGIAYWSAPAAMIVAGASIIFTVAGYVNIDRESTKRDPQTLRRVPPAGHPSRGMPGRMFPAPEKKAK